MQKDGIKRTGIKRKKTPGWNRARGSEQILATAQQPLKNLPNKASGISFKLLQSGFEPVVTVELKKHRAAARGDADLSPKLVDRAVLLVGADARKISAELLHNAVPEMAVMGQDLRVGAALFARAL